MADSKITALTELTDPAVADLLPAVDDVAGTATTKKVTLQNISDLIAVTEPNNASSMARQAIINGNFDVWQRGVSFSNPVAGGAFFADRWSAAINADSGTLPTSLIYTREALTSGDIANSFYHMRLATNGAGSGFGANAIHRISHKIEHGTRLLCGNGKKVTVSFYARSSIANKKLGVNLRQNYGTTGSPTSEEVIAGTNWTLTSTWTKYTYTFTTNTLASKTFGTDNNDQLQLDFLPMWGTNIATRVGAGTTAETFVGSGNIDIAQVQLCAGDVALPFMPKSFEEELRACMRYYEKSFLYTVAPAQNTNQYSGSLYYKATATTLNVITVNYLVPKRTSSPTFTTYNPAAADNKWKNIEGGSDVDATPYATSNNSFRIGIDGIVTAGHRFGIHWTADAEL